MKTETINFDTPNGATAAYVAVPNPGSGSKAVILIHEWWGLNGHIKDIAGRYTQEGFTAIAPDLYRGRAAKDPDEAAALMQGLGIEDGLATIKSAMAKAGETYGFRKFCISGYCMGGTFALRAACELEHLAAAAPFYGDVPGDDVLEKLKTPTIFISGKRDGWINPDKVAALEKAAAEFGLPVESIAYDADHAFFNDTRPEVYDPAAAADAWKKVIHFFNLNL
jgi:carboxymethylenebutenolidase